MEPSKVGLEFFGVDTPTENVVAERMAGSDTVLDKPCRGDVVDLGRLVGPEDACARSRDGC